jgi:hypothetical protein
MPETIKPDSYIEQIGLAEEMAYAENDFHILSKYAGGIALQESSSDEADGKNIIKEALLNEADNASKATFKSSEVEKPHDTHELGEALDELGVIAVHRGHKPSDVEQGISAGGDHYDMPRATIHWSLNHLVTPHLHAEHDGDYIVLSPLSSLVEANGAPAVLYPVDTYFKVSSGDVLDIPNNSTIIELNNDQEEAVVIDGSTIMIKDNLSPEETLEVANEFGLRPEVVEFQTLIEGVVASQILRMGSGTVVKGGAHYTNNDKFERDISSVAKEYGLRTGLHYAQVEGRFEDAYKKYIYEVEEGDLSQQTVIDLWALAASAGKETYSRMIENGQLPGLKKVKTPEDVGDVW